MNMSDDRQEQQQQQTRKKESTRGCLITPEPNREGMSEWWLTCYPNGYFTASRWGSDL